MSIEISKIKSSTKQKEKKAGSGKTSLMELLNKDISIFKKKLKDKKKETFFSELSILLSSGIDIKTSLELIVEEQTKKADKELLSGIYSQVVEGNSLSDALEASAMYNEYDYYSIRIGEESGKLASVLKELSIFYLKKVKQKRQLSNAFSYPIIVLITAILAVTFMLNVIVPMFVDVFARTNNELPKLTRVIINLSESVSGKIKYLILLIILLIIFIQLVKKKKAYRNFSTKFMLRLPLFGKIIKMIYLGRFFQSMALLISSKVDILRAIKLVKKMIRFYQFEAALEIIENDILHGKLLNESMQQFKLFDRRIISLIKVGEEVNQLDTIFDKLNSQYNEELEHKISLLSSLLEPLLIIFVGLFVAVILISMYLPMFKMGNSLL